MDFLKAALEEYVCHANDAIELRLVRKKEDVEDDQNVFCPEFTHQLFGQNENIFGYKGLKVKLYFTAGCLNSYLSLSCEEEVSGKKFEGVKADPVLKTIIDHLEIKPTSNMDEFLSSLPEEASFNPMGDLIHSYSVEVNSGTRKFEVYKCSITTPKFRDYHERLQTFLWWFVDAASYIDVDDDKWMYYVIFEKYPMNDGKQYAVVGYATVYRYYAYPDKIRPRISQVLVLPPFQRQGHGKVFLETIYRDIQTDKDVLDITVEDPSESFTRLRDYVDCRACSELPSFAPERLIQGFSSEMEQEARKKFKINKKQARRIYEILRLKSTDRSNAVDYRAYRLDVKKRLNIPFQKQKSDYEKMKRVLKPEELTATTEGTSLEERQKTLENWYSELLSDYEKVLERLATF